MTVSSPVDLCNLTLDLLNQKLITSIETPETPNEETCARWYDQVRRESLRRHPWNFATKRAILAPDAAAPLFGYNKAFTLPADYIRIKYLNESVLVRDHPIPQSQYVVEGGKIKIGAINTSDSDQLRLVYVSDFTNVTQMDPSFIEYFVTALAQRISYKITQSNSTVQRLDALMDKEEEKARAMDGQENPPKRIERSRNRAARRNNGGVRNFDGITVFE